MATLLQDTFTDTNGTALQSHTMNVGSGWSVAAGAIAIQSNRADPTGAASAYAIADAGAADYVASLDGHTPANGANAFNLGLIVRHSGISEDYWLAIVAGSVNTGVLAEIYEVVGGSFTNRDSHAVTLANDTTYAITAEVSGTSLVLKIDGTQRASWATMATGAGRTKCGMWLRDTNDAGDVWADNFLVSSGAGTLSLTNAGGIASGEAFGTPTVTLVPVIQLPARLKLRSSNRPTLKLRSERGALPDIPLPPPPSGNPIISAPDWTLVGILRLPSTVTVGGVPRSTAWGYAPLGARRVGGAKRLFSTAWFGGSVYEVAVPGSLGSDLASAPIASVVNVWDDGTGSFYGGLAQEPPGGSGGLQIRSLRWFDGDAHLNAGLFWSYGEKYAGQEDWPSLGYTTISGSTATPYKVWKLAGLGSGYRRTGALPMPDGRICMVGGGGFSGIGAGFSFGPALFAMATADMASTASGGNVPYETLLNYPIPAINAPPYVLPTPALRDNDYRPAVYGIIDRNASAADKVPVPVANFSDFTSQGVGRTIKVRGVARTVTAWDAVNYVYTVNTPYSFTPGIGDDVEIPLDDNPAASSIALWMPQGSIGYFTGNEHVGQPVWRNGASKRGVIFPVALIKGRIHYQGGGGHIEGRKHHAYVYNPDNLNGSANIDRTNTIDMAPLGLPDPDTFFPFSGELGREVNFADDPVDGRVYAILNYAWTDGGGEYFPAVYVYQVNS